MQQHRARGLESATELFGSVNGIIDDRLKNKQKVRILELGFGFGMLLFELRQAYGSKIELAGINKRESDGNWGLAIKSAVHKGILKEKDAADIIAPHLIYHDLDSGIPLADNSFDIIISQVCIFNIVQKAYCLEEVNRVLDKDGIALLDLMAMRSEVQEPNSISFSVLEKGKKISFWKYAARFSNLRKKKNIRRYFLYLEKSAKFSLDLEIVSFLDLAKLDPDLKGINSIYKPREQKKY